MPPKPRAFIVSTQWEGGVGSLNLCVEYSSEIAAATAVVVALRSDPVPTGSLTNLQVREIDAATLRTALTQLETGKPSAPVVQLVPQQDGRLDELLTSEGYGEIIRERVLKMEPPEPDPPEPPVNWPDRSA